MALAYSMIALLIIGIIFLAALFIIGLIFLIIGIISKAKTANVRKKFPTVFIVIGSLLLSIPVLTVILFAAGGISSQISTSIKRQSYTSVTDKWRNEWTTDHSAAKAATEQLFSAAEAEDWDLFKKTFTPNIQNSPSFEKAVDEFIAAYPKGIGKCELEGGAVSSGGSYNHGHNTQHGSTDYTCTLDGKWYCIRLSFCYECTDSPDDVGVDFLSIENLEGYALDEDYSGKNLVCNIKSENEVSARLIHNSGFIFQPYPERNITVQQIKEYLEKYDDLYHLEQEIGKPNVNIKYDNCTGYDHYYELAPENGEPRYAYLCTNSPTGRFISGYVCSDTKSFYDIVLFKKKD